MDLVKISKRELTLVLIHCQGNCGSRKVINFLKHTDCECRSQSGNLGLFDLSARTSNHKLYCIFTNGECIRGSEWRFGSGALGNSGRVGMPALWGPYILNPECLIAHVADLSAKGDHQTCKDFGISEVVF